ncbi:MAG: peptidylprolyl isomerase [Candidatus Eisenbacteria bacterium]
MDRRFGIRRVRLHLGTTLLAMGLGLVASVTALRAAPPAEEIVAVVGDRPILRSEVEEQFEIVAAQYQLSPADTAETRQLRSEILDQLISNELLFLEGVARGLDVTDEELDAAVRQAEEENIQGLGGEPAFLQELSLQGMTREMFRSRVRDLARREGVTRRLVQRDIRPKVDVTDQDVRAFYDEHKAELPPRARGVRIQDLFIEVKPDSFVAERALQKAKDVRKEITAGMAFAEAAKLYSDDPTGDSGGLLPEPIQRGMLSPELEAIAFALPTGVVSEPILTPYGYNLIQVEEKDPNGAWVRVRIILLGVATTRSDIAAAEARAANVRKKIAGGLDFTEAIRKYSEDEISKQKDGNMGWISMQNFMGELRTAIETLKVGEISQPIPGDNGYHILRILEEEPERPFEFTEIREKASASGRSRPAWKRN